MNLASAQSCEILYVNLLHLSYKFLFIYFLFFCSKRRKAEKVGKGLRHFSMKVCEKVKKKGTTSYNEVADELVGEFTNPAHVNSLTDQVFVSLYSL